MRTIKEITAYLRTLEVKNETYEQLTKDTRIGVQKAIGQWEKRYEKRQQVKQEHEEKVQFDKQFTTIENALIAGVDEVGRGPLAGPVVTAAVILGENTDALCGLNDSKTISIEKRQQFTALIKEHAIAYEIHIQPAEKVDALNIYQATRMSMEQAVMQLKVAPDFVIVDAMNLSIPYPTESVVKADEQSLSVAAASILAKTTRDDFMVQLHKEYPYYQFDKNAGYGTAAHLAGLEAYGICPEHRKTFEPIKTMIQRGG